MVNKYTATGIAFDAAARDKRIVVVVPRQQEVREALEIFEQLELVTDNATTIKRANGAERIDFSMGGSIRIRSARQSLRGYAADAIYVEEDVVRHTLTSEQWERYRIEVMPMLNAHGGELIIGC